MRNKLSSSLEQLIEYCWLGAVFALPLAISPLGGEIFQLPKVLVLITLAELLLIFSFFNYFLAAPQRFPADPTILWTVLCCCLAAAGATILSSGFQDSLVGTFGRHQGLITMLCYLTIMMSMALYLQSQNQVLLILKTLVWTSGPICLFGLLQFFGFNPFDWITDSKSPLLVTLGRSNFFGAYLVLLLPLSLTLLAIPKRFDRLIFLLVVLQLVCLALSQARSSWIGLGAALLTWLILNRLRFGRHLSMPRFFPLLFIAASTWLAASFLAEPLGLAPPVGFTSLSDFFLARGGSVAARLTIWQRSVDLILQQPWLGYGFDTIEAVFSRHFPPELVYYQGRHVMVDRAHNLWLDLGLSTGLLGVAAMASLFIITGCRVYNKLQVSVDANMRLILLGLAAALTGHLVDLQFSFDLTTNGAIFWMLIGIAIAMARDLPATDPHLPRSRLSHLRLGILWLLFFSILFSRWPLQVLQADRLFAQAFQSGRPLPESIEKMTQAVRLQPRNIHYRLSLANLYSSNGNIDAAENNLQAAWSLRPNDPWIMLQQGHLYSHFQNVSPEYLNKAELAYRQTVKLAPDISSFHTVLAMILIRQRSYYAALSELKEALRLDETDPIAYTQLAGLFELLGYRDRAQEAHLQAQKWIKHEQDKAGR